MKKNWKLFRWAFKRLKIDISDSDRVFRKCFKNYILWWLMDLSGVTPQDIRFDYRM